MDWNIWLPIIVIVALAIINCSMWVSIAGGVLVYFMFLGAALPSQIIVQRIAAIIENQTYLAIPFFITAGCIMNYSGISKRLMDFADGLVGHLSGGLGHVNVLLSTLMGGVSGSSTADAAMECKVLVPEMLRLGYDETFSVAVTAASSLITSYIPPGMGMIIFAFVTQISVGRLLSAGYIPGLLSMLLMMIYVGWKSKRKGYKGSRNKMAEPKELLQLFINGIWALLMPFGLIMVLRFGIITATEAGALCALYSAIVGIFIYKELKWKHVWPILMESILGVATVMILICVANALSFFLTYEQIPQALSNFILNANLNKWTFMLLVNILLLGIGMLMEGGAPIIILGPMLLPIAVTLGIDPIHFGMVFIFNVGIGKITPPFGLVLYQVAGLLDIKLKNLIIELLPFIGILVFVLILIVLFPQLVLFIPNLIYGVSM